MLYSYYCSDPPWHVDLHAATKVESRRSAWEHNRSVPNGAMAAAAAATAGAGGAHFAPFEPNAEDHLRNFAVSPDERKQMEEDYRLALAMQKGEAVAATSSTGTTGSGRGTGDAPGVCTGVCWFCG